MSTALILFIVAAVALAAYALKRKSNGNGESTPDDTFPNRSTSDRDAWSNEPLDPP